MNGGSVPVESLEDAFARRKALIQSSLQKTMSDTPSNSSNSSKGQHGRCELIHSALLAAEQSGLDSDDETKISTKDYNNRNSGKGNKALPSRPSKFGSAASKAKSPSARKSHLRGVQKKRLPLLSWNTDKKLPDHGSVADVTSSTDIDSCISHDTPPGEFVRQPSPLKALRQRFGGVAAFGRQQRRSSTGAGIASATNSSNQSDLLQAESRAAKQSRRSSFSASLGFSSQHSGKDEDPMLQDKARAKKQKKKKKKSMKQKKQTSKAQQKEAKTQSIPTSVTVRTPTPQEFLDRLLESRGYQTKTYEAIKTGYYSDPTELQKASYHSHFCGLVRANNMRKIRPILECGISLNPCNSLGSSLIHGICRRGQMGILKLFIMRGAELKIADTYGRTPLHDACWAANEPVLETVHLIMSITRDFGMFHLTDTRGLRPLDYVREEHHAAWIKFLDSQKDIYWPALSEGSQPNNMSKLVRQEPNSRPLKDPDNALPPDLACMVVAGCIAPVEALVLCQVDDEEDDVEDLDDDEFDNMSCASNATSGSELTRLRKYVKKSYAMVEVSKKAGVYYDEEEQPEVDDECSDDDDSSSNSSAEDFGERVVRPRGESY